MECEDMDIWSYGHKENVKIFSHLNLSETVTNLHSVDQSADIWYIDIE